MTDKNTHPDSSSDSRLDAFAAVSFILIAVLTAVFWVSQH